MTERKFFDRLLNRGVSNVLSWFLMGFLIFIILILSMIPAQEVYAEGNKFLSWGLVFLSAFMSAARVSAYKTITIDNFEYIFLKVLLVYTLWIRV